MPTISQHDSIGDDLLRGAQAIADYTGLKVRDVFDKLEKGYLPATKEGNLWVASKTRLRAHYGIPVTTSTEAGTEASPGIERPPRRQVPPPVIERRRLGRVT